MSKRTPPVRITQAELAALRWHFDHSDPKEKGWLKNYKKTNKTLAKLSGLFQKETK